MVGGNAIHGYNKDALKLLYDEPLGNHMFFLRLTKYYKHIFTNLSHVIIYL